MYFVFTHLTRHKNKKWLEECDTMGWVCKYYNKNQQNVGVKRPIHSLEMKWGVIKHDIAKFIGNFQSIQTFCTFKTDIKKTLQKNFGLI